MPQKTLSLGQAGKICQCFLPQRSVQGFSTVGGEELGAPYTLDQGGENRAGQGWLAQASPQWTRFTPRFHECLPI